MMNTKTRYAGLQTDFAQLNKTSCHLLTLLSIAEEENYRLGKSNPYVDFIDVLRVSRSKGWVDSEYYVHDNFAVLNYCTGTKWSRRRVDKLPSVIKDNEYTECHYEWTRKKDGEIVTTEHFTRRGIDTLRASETVRNGKITYYNIYTSEV